MCDPPAASTPKCSTCLPRIGTIRAALRVGQGPASRRVCSPPITWSRSACRTATRPGVEAAIGCLDLTGVEGGDVTRTTQGGCSNRSRLWQTGCVIAGAAFLAACSPSGTAHTATKRPATTTTSTPQDAVLRSYSMAVAAIADAERHADPQWPQLLASVVDPELAHIQGFIRLETSLKYHDAGTERIIRSEVSTFSATKATVRACLYGALIAYQANGQPAPGNAGEVTYGIVTATLVPVAPGRWALQEATAQQFPTVQAAGEFCSG